MNFLDQLDMKRKFFKSSYQTINPSKELMVDDSAFPHMIDHNIKGGKAFELKKKGKKTTKKGQKSSIRDIMSNEYVNSFIFPEIKSSVQHSIDQSRISGLTFGTIEDTKNTIFNVIDRSARE